MKFWINQIGQQLRNDLMHDKFTIFIGIVTISIAFFLSAMGIVLGIQGLFQLHMYFGYERGWVVSLMMAGEIFFVLVTILLVRSYTRSVKRVHNDFIDRMETDVDN